MKKIISLPYKEVEQMSSRRIGNIYTSMPKIIEYRHIFFRLSMKPVNNRAGKYITCIPAKPQYVEIAKAIDPQASVYPASFFSRICNEPEDVPVFFEAFLTFDSLHYGTLEYTSKQHLLYILRLAYKSIDWMVDNIDKAYDNTDSVLHEIKNIKTKKDKEENQLLTL